MKNPKRIKVSFLTILLFAFVHAQAQDIKFMSFNIRYENLADAEFAWKYRKTEMIDFLSHYAPQIIATQEGLINQITFLNKNLLNYQYVGIGRDNGKTKGEFCAIFYDTTELELLNQETFWLSKTPEIVSVGWDASMERICTYAKFKHKSNNKKFWVFNTHFDHLGKRARKKSAKLILKMIAENNTENHPVVLMGDLNAYPTSKAIKIIADYFGDPLNETQLIGDESTFNDFGRTNTSKRIDYMFFKGWKIKSYHHLSNHWNNKTFLSDHKAVFAELSF